MALRVPRRPDTPVPTQQQGYVQEVRGLDVTPITDSIAAIRKKLDEDRRAQQKFQLNRRLMDEVNALTSDFEARKRDPSIGLDTFAETTNQTYDDRHRALTEELWQEGVDEDLLEEFDGRLATVRQGFFGNALGHQVGQLRVRAEDELNDYGRSASQLATSNPDAWTSVEEDIRETVSANPYLTEAEKIAKTDELIGIARQGAGKAFALQRPGDVIQLLDPQGFTAPPTVGVTPGRGPVSGWQGVATTVADTLGLDATEVAAVMSFESAGTFDPKKMGGAGGNYMGLIQFGPEERRTYGIDADSTPEEWTNAILGFMQDRGFRKGMGLEDFYSTILTGSPGNYDATDANGTNVRNAIPRILSEHRPNAERWLASAIQTIDPGASTAEQAPPLSTLQAPQPIVAGNLPLNVQQEVQNEDGTVSTVRTISIGTDNGEVLIPTVIGGRVVSDEEAIRHYEETGENFGTFENAKDATAYAEALHESHEQQIAPATTIAEVQTGVPILDALNGPERLQVLAWAREQQNRRVASQKAAMDVTIGNITAEALENGGEIATPIPREEDVLAVYGPVEGPQRWAEIQRSVSTGKAIETFRTMSDTQIAAELTRLEPVPGTPTYETELQIYQAAERAAEALAEERERDPAAYAMKYFPSVGEAAQQGTAEYYAELDRVYQQLGIDSDYAAVLPAETMERVIQDYKAMAPSQRKAYIQSNFRAMGEDRFARFASQMDGTTAADDARIYALMRNYRGQPGEWDNIYTMVLEGREVIAQDPARRPSSQALREQFRLAGLSAIGNLDGKASRAVQEAAAAIYVAKNGHPERIDPNIYRESLRLALGGNLPVAPSTYTRQGQVKDFTILPSGVNVRQFNNWIDTLQPGELTRLSLERLPPLQGDLKTKVELDDIIDQGVFVMTSPGTYMIKMAENGEPLLTRTGRPFLVNVNQSTVLGQ